MTVKARLNFTSKLIVDTDRLKDLEICVSCDARNIQQENGTKVTQLNYNYFISLFFQTFITHILILINRMIPYPVKECFQQH